MVWVPGVGGMVGMGNEGCGTPMAYGTGYPCIYTTGQYTPGPCYPGQCTQASIPQIQCILGYFTSNTVHSGLFYLKYRVNTGK